MANQADPCFRYYVVSVLDPRVGYLCDYMLIGIIALAINWEQVEKGHGRPETRRGTVLTDADPPALRPGHGGRRRLAGAARQVGGGGAPSGGADSAPHAHLHHQSGGDAREAGRSVREHWGIENRLHWVLDIAFREDESRIRVGNGPHLFATLRRLALNELQREGTAKGGVHAKRLRAAWDHDYLLQVLRG